MATNQERSLIIGMRINPNYTGQDGNRYRKEGDRFFKVVARPDHFELGAEVTDLKAILRILLKPKANSVPV